MTTTMWYGLSPIQPFYHGPHSNPTFAQTLEVTYREEWEDPRLKFLALRRLHLLPACQEDLETRLLLCDCPRDQVCVSVESWMSIEEERLALPGNQPTCSSLGWSRKANVTTSQRFTLKLDCQPASASYPIENHVVCYIRIGSCKPSCRWRGEGR